MVKFTLDQFESIGDKYASRLKDRGINSVDDFYNYSIDEIKSIAKVDQKRADQWRDILEIFKIPKITIRDAELLYYANVNSIEELSHRRASRIFYKFKKIDKESYFIILKLPTFSQIDEWIYFAKLITKRIKSDYNIPLVKFSLLNIDQLSELAKYRIWTVEEFLKKYSQIRGLRKKLKMTQDQFNDLLTLLKLVEIDGIDSYLANIFFEAGIKSKEEFLNLNEDKLINSVLEIQKSQNICPEKITKDLIEKLKSNIKEMSEK